MTKQITGLRGRGTRGGTFSRRDHVEEEYRNAKTGHRDHDQREDMAIAFGKALNCHTTDAEDDRCPTG